VAEDHAGVFLPLPFQAFVQTRVPFRGNGRLKRSVLAPLFDDRPFEPQHFNAKLLVHLFDLVVDRRVYLVLGDPGATGLCDRTGDEVGIGASGMQCRVEPSTLP
jgi:hypothetical protein